MDMDLRLSTMARLTAWDFTGGMSQSTRSTREETQVSTTLVEPVLSGEVAVLDGRNAHLSDGLQRALGREPRDFTDDALAARARTEPFARS